jgi:hypothetical protein
LWSDQVPQKDGTKSSINDIAISPGIFCTSVQLVIEIAALCSDGLKIIVAVGNRVLLYDAETGDLMESLRGKNCSKLNIAGYVVLKGTRRL